MTNIVILSDKRGRQVGPPEVGEVVDQLDLFKRISDAINYTQVSTF